MDIDVLENFQYFFKGDLDRERHRPSEYLIFNYCKHQYWGLYLPMNTNYLEIFNIYTGDEHGK